MRPAGSVILLALLASGCGSGPELAVHGVVTLDGVPLDGAAVTFYPEEKAGGTGGSARTGTDGKFVLVGPKRQAGLPPGKYKVTVSKLKGGPVTDEPVLAAVTEAEAKNDLPAIYSNPAETILSFSVTRDGKPIEIPLRSKPKK